MSRFSLIRWCVEMEGSPFEAAPVVVFQSGHVFLDGARVGTYCQTADNFVAGLDVQTTMLVPLDQEGPDRYSAHFRVTDGDREVRRVGAMVRERYEGA